jgi:hypothetical protein
VNDGRCDVIEVTSNQHKVSYRNDVNEYNIYRTIQFGPTITQNSFDLLSEIILIGTIMNEQQATSEKKSCSDCQENKQRTY